MDDDGVRVRVKDRVSKADFFSPWAVLKRRAGVGVGSALSEKSAGIEGLLTENESVSFLCDPSFRRSCNVSLAGGGADAGGSSEWESDGKLISEWIVARGEGGMTPIVTLGFVCTERLSWSGVLAPLGFCDDFLTSVASEGTRLRRGDGSREDSTERSLLLALLDARWNFERKLGAMISYDKLNFGFDAVCWH